jgi:hypothetical protein
VRTLLAKSPRKFPAIYGSSQTPGATGDNRQHLMAFGSWAGLVVIVKLYKHGSELGDFLARYANPVTCKCQTSAQWWMLLMLAVS